MNDQPRSSSWHLHAGMPTYYHHYAYFTRFFPNIVRDLPVRTISRSAEDLVMLGRARHLSTSRAFHTSSLNTSAFPLDPLGLPRPQSRATRSTDSADLDSPGEPRVQSHDMRATWHEARSSLSSPGIYPLSMARHSTYSHRRVDDVGIVSPSHPFYHDTDSIEVSEWRLTKYPGMTHVPSGALYYPTTAGDGEKHETSTLTDAVLFLCGFLCFPLWWIGAWRLRWRPAPKISHYHTTWLTRRRFQQLNGIMSLTSILLLGVLVGMVTWYTQIVASGP